MTRGRLHMIGNAHIDPVWLWNWQEGYHEVIATFRSALDRLDESDDFVFVSSAAIFYAWIERHDPAMFARIAGRVAEGRWEVVGGWWLQPDCNVPGGESYVRQALYGQRWFKEKLGVTARVGYNVDTFGHHAMLPQLLKLSRLDAYVFLRPGPHELGLPARLFWWESDDGSRVLGYRIPFEYNTWGKELDASVTRCASELRDPVDELMCFYGVGNHGGGPTKANIESIRRLQGDPDGPELVFSSPNRYFDAVRERGWDLPVVHRDLQHHASGCYAAHSGIKRWNRRAEWLLATAEAISSLAQRVTGCSLQEDLAHAWKGVLFNQDHDILPGTSIESAYDDARDLYGEAMSIGARALNDAVMALTWRIGVPFEEGVRPLLAFNPHGWASTVPVELETTRIRDEHVLLDDEGREVPLQAVQSEATANGRSRALFVADLPALGYRSYRLVVRERPAGASGGRASTPSLTASETTLESARFRLEVDPATGCLVSLFDKRAGTETLAGPAAHPVVLDDPSDTWGHNVYRFDRVAGAFTAVRVSCIERGPVRATLRIVSEYGASRLVQDVSLLADGGFVDVRATLDWREPNAALKLRFPLNLQYMRATYEIPYGHIERFANGEEEPGGAWIDLSGSARDTGALYGVSLLNDGLHSFDVDVRDVGMTITRNPVYAHHIPAALEPGAEYSYTDHGLQRFRYRILPHAAGWVEGETVRRAIELNARAIVLNDTFHDGPLPPSTSFAGVDHPAVVICALKRAEDGGATIVRARETSGNRAHATIDLTAWGRSIDTTFGPNQIRTFLVPDDDEASVVETDLIEWPV